MNEIFHPVHQAMEGVYANAHTPRLHINATLPTVRVPDHVRETWATRLVIDLDPNYPLRMHTDKNGVEVDLSFQGRVSRCFFPWRSIYVVANRDTGKGEVFSEHFPGDIDIQDGSNNERKTPHMPIAAVRKTNRPAPLEARELETPAPEKRRGHLSLVPPSADGAKKPSANGTKKPSSVAADADADNALADLVTENTPKPKRRASKPKKAAPEIENTAGNAAELLAGAGTTNTASDTKQEEPAPSTTAPTLSERPRPSLRLLTRNEHDE